MPRKRTYTDEQFIEAVEKSLSWRQVLQKLNLNATGGNYTSMKNLASRLGTNTEHFTGKGWNKGDRYKSPSKRDTKDILVEDSTYTSTHHLKHRLWKEGLLRNECYECAITEWNDKPISLQLDHINGKRTDNRLENLRILCPNCHSQTITFAGKNK